MTAGIAQPWPKCRAAAEKPSCFFWCTRIRTVVVLGISLTSQESEDPERGTVGDVYFLFGPVHGDRFAELLAEGNP